MKNLKLIADISNMFIIIFNYYHFRLDDFIIFFFLVMISFLFIFHLTAHFLDV